MTTPGSTTESRTAALAMFEGHVPCIYQFNEPSCEETAKWIASFVHEENVKRCDDANLKWPVCDTHKKMIQAASHPFWRTWRHMRPIPCDRCRTPVRLDRIDQI
jgi:hypothetical protein